MTNKNNFLKQLQKIVAVVFMICLFVVKVNAQVKSTLPNIVYILADDLGLGPEDEGIGNYAFKEADTTNMTPYQKYRFYCLNHTNRFDHRVFPPLDWKLAMSAFDCLD